MFDNRKYSQWIFLVVDCHCSINSNRSAKIMNTKVHVSVLTLLLCVVTVTFCYLLDQGNPANQVESACARLKVDAVKINQLVDKRMAKIAVVSKTFAHAKNLLAQLPAGNNAFSRWELAVVAYDLHQATCAQHEFSNLSDAISRQCGPTLADIRTLRKQFGLLTAGQKQKLQAERTLALQQINAACAYERSTLPPFAVWAKDYQDVQARAKAPR
jgi:hypothetical protein